MQNNVTELSQKLLRSLDSNYNVIDMPTVIEIISLLEKTAITKELLETTRLGRHVNELRRNTKNETLAKRAKELVKKWRDLVLPESNGQLKSTISVNANNDQSDLNLNQVKSRKRTAKDKLEASNAKWSHLNGQHSELELSDNSNSSFFDQQQLLLQKRREVIVVNDDSNSSIPDRTSDAGSNMDISAPAEDITEVQPKKRGRKKGSKNHTALIVEAATSFTNKMNATRNTDRKVKTTQELLADIQNKSTAVGGTTTPATTSPASSTKPAIEDMNVRAAKLTERVSIIDQKLNANQRYKNATQRKGFTLKNVTDRGGTVFREDSSAKSANDRRLLDVRERDDEDDVVVVVDDDDSKVSQHDSLAALTGDASAAETPEPAGPASLSVEEALSQLPAVDKSSVCAYDSDEEHACTCQVAEPCPLAAVVVGSTNTPSSSPTTNNNDPPERSFVEAVEDPLCAARSHLADRYKLSCVSDASVTDLLTERLPSVNGNYSSVSAASEEPALDDRGLYVNVVPKHEEVRVPTAEPPSENYKKYSISNADRATALTDFREWHETLDVESYGGDTFRILPYVIID